MPTMPASGEGGRLPVWTLALGLYLVVAALYVLSSPGRIDIVDGQVRFEATRSLVEEGRPALHDSFVQPYGTRMPDGSIYSAYGAGPQVVAMPLVWLGGLADDARGETQMFLFSLTSTLLGAGIAPILLLFFLELGHTRASAVAWTLVAAFASLLWQGSTSVFDQSQHAFLVVLAGFLAFVAARRDRLWPAAAGGAAAGLLLNYQETYVLLLPLLAAATLGGAGSPERKRNRLLVFLAVSAIGLVPWMGYNWLCFDNPLTPGKLRPGLMRHPDTAGNVLGGLTGLLASPGKSVFLYSPTFLLGLAGLRRLWRRERELAAAVLLASLVHLVFISSVNFWHGDWCWGPRYLIPLLPLWALAAPLAWRRRRQRRIWVGAVVAAGVLTQLLGLAVVHERFFHERGLGGFFWARDPGFYLRESALLARPGEIRTLLSGKAAESARRFSNNPYDSPTYFIAGFPRPDQGATLMRDFQVFYLPRPWPLWVPRLDTARYARPVDPTLWIPSLLAVLLVGAALTAAATSRSGAEPRASGASPEAGS